MPSYASPCRSKKKRQKKRRSQAKTCAHTHISHTHAPKNLVPWSKLTSRDTPEQQNTPLVLGFGCCWCRKIQGSCKNPACTLFFPYTDTHNTDIIDGLGRFSHGHGHARQANTSPSRRGFCAGFLCKRAFQLKQTFHAASSGRAHRIVSETPQTKSEDRFALLFMRQVVACTAVWMRPQEKGFSEKRSRPHAHKT